MNEIFKNACMLMGLATLPACQSGGPGEALNLTLGTAPLPLIASIGKSIQRCWFKSSDPVFTKFRMANESNSYAGRPRLLLVPRNNPGGLPSLVIQAEEQDGKSKLQVFGPLLSSNTGQKISTDLKKWAAGNTSCNG